MDFKTSIYFYSFGLGFITGVFIMIVCVSLFSTRMEIKTIPECQIPKNAHKLDCEVNAETKEIICKGVMK